MDCRIDHRFYVIRFTPPPMPNEDLDYDPKEQAGVELKGFLRSKVCKGLNITDNHVDSFHVYWNHKDSQFDWWSR